METNQRINPKGLHMGGGGGGFTVQCQWSAGGSAGGFTDCSTESSVFLSSPVNTSAAHVPAALVNLDMTHNRGFPSLRCLVAHTHMPSHTHTHFFFNKINKIPFQQWLGLVMSCSLNACCGNHKNELLQFYCINHMWLNVTKLKLKPMSRLRMFGWEIKNRRRAATRPTLRLLQANGYFTHLLHFTLPMVFCPLWYIGV